MTALLSCLGLVGIVVLVQALGSGEDDLDREWKAFVEGRLEFNA